MIGEAFAMGTQGGGAGGGGGLATLLPFILIFVILYLLILRPQQRRQKEQRAMLDSLKKGDKVVTNGGIYGTIVGFKGDTVVLRIAHNGKNPVDIELVKHSISGVVTTKKGKVKEKD